jgi:hypothetical protein
MSAQNTATTSLNIRGTALTQHIMAGAGSGGGGGVGGGGGGRYGEGSRILDDEQARQMLRRALKSAEAAGNYYKINDMVSQPAAESASYGIVCVCPEPVLTNGRFLLCCDVRVCGGVSSMMTRQVHTLAKERSLSGSISGGIEALGGWGKSLVLGVRPLLCCC